MDPGIKIPVLWRLIIEKDIGENVTFLDMNHLEEVFTGQGGILQ